MEVMVENEAQRRPQRPTSLPIQPFVMGPMAKGGAPQVGCLLDQYLTQKSSKVSTSQPGSKFKGKRSRCFSSLQLSPMGGHYPVFLEPPSSSDTSSSCTPSPEWLGRRHTWSQSSRSPGPFSPCTSKRSPKHPQVQALEDTTLTLTPPPNRSTLIKIPTYQDLNHLTPKLNYSRAFTVAHTSRPSFSQTPPTLSAHSRGCSPSTRSEPEQPPSLPPRATPAADPGFFGGAFTAAVAPLSSLSGALLSFAAAVGTSQPTDFSLSPDTSYESMSISHLQRRGETARPHLATASAAFLLGCFAYSP